MEDGRSKAKRSALAHRRHVNEQAGLGTDSARACSGSARDVTSTARAFHAYTILVMVTSLVESLR